MSEDIPNLRSEAERFYQNMKDFASFSEKDASVLDDENYRGWVINSLKIILDGVYLRGLGD